MSMSTTAASAVPYVVFGYGSLIFKVRVPAAFEVAILTPIASTRASSPRRMSYRKARPLPLVPDPATRAADFHFRARIASAGLSQRVRAAVRTEVARPPRDARGTALNIAPRRPLILNAIWPEPR